MGKGDFKAYYRAGKSVYSQLTGLVFLIFEPGFWAVKLYRLSHGLYRIKLWPLALVVMRLNKFLFHVDISYECKIGRALRLPHCQDIVIGSTAVIGDDVQILNGVTLGSVELRTAKKRHPTIENGVLIGSGAKVLGPLTVGELARIGANSVVVKDVDSHQTVVGVPAREVEGHGHE